MSGSTLRLIVFFVFMIHGIGQLMGVIPALRLFGADTDHPPAWGKSWSSRSWLLTEKIGEPMSRILGAVLYLAAFFLFIASALALQDWLLPHSFWRILAVAGAVVSFLALFLFWKALLLLFPHKIGNIAVNLAVIVGLIVLHWPMESQLGF